MAKGEIVTLFSKDVCYRGVRKRLYVGKRYMSPGLKSHLLQICSKLESVLNCIYSSHLLPPEKIKCQPYYSLNNTPILIHSAHQLLYLASMNFIC